MSEEPLRGVLNTILKTTGLHDTCVTTLGFFPNGSSACGFSYTPPGSLFQYDFLNIFFHNTSFPLYSFVADPISHEYIANDLGRLGHYSVFFHCSFSLNLPMLYRHLFPFWYPPVRSRSHYNRLHINGLPGTGEFPYRSVYIGSFTRFSAFSTFLNRR